MTISQIVLFYTTRKLCFVKIKSSYDYEINKNISTLRLETAWVRNIQSQCDLGGIYIYIYNVRVYLLFDNLLNYGDLYFIIQISKA